MNNISLFSKLFRKKAGRLGLHLKLILNILYDFVYTLIANDINVTINSSNLPGLTKLPDGETPTGYNRSIEKNFDLDFDERLTMIQPIKKNVEFQVDIGTLLKSISPNVLKVTDPSD